MERLSKNAGDFSKQCDDSRRVMVCVCVPDVWPKLGRRATCDDPSDLLFWRALAI